MKKILFGSIKERLIVMALAAILTLCAFVLVGGYFSWRFERAYRKMGDINQVVLWIQKARIAEKAYRKYYEDRYQKEVFGHLARTQTLLADMPDRFAGNERKLRKLARSYRRSFQRLISLHRENTDLGKRLGQRMAHVNKHSRAMIRRIHARDFRARTTQGRPLGDMESGLLSPLQDVNSLALLVQLNHQQFLHTNEARYLDSLHEHIDWYGPGLFGSLEQGARYLDNPFYMAAVEAIRHGIDDSLALLRESRTLLAAEEESVLRLGLLGEDLDGVAGNLLEQATVASVNTKRNVTMIIGAIFLLSTLLIIVFVSALTTAITRPLSHMVAVAHAIRGGNLALAIHVKREDEFGDLATAFNDMTRHLGDSLTRLKREVAERKSAERNLRRLSRQLITGMERERAAVARELHDELGQVLTALKIDAVWLRNHAETADPGAVKRIGNMCGFIDGTIDEVRNLALRLRPKVLDDLGLVAAIKWLAGDFQRRTGIRVAFCSGSHIVSDDTVSSTVYRVVQESLTNVMRHAGATRVDITFARKPGLLGVTITDDGKGFDAEGGGESRMLGMTGMRERAHLIGGRLEIRSRPGKGCTVSLSVPVPEREGGEDDQSIAGR